MAGDTNGVLDIFRKDLLTGRTERVSTTSSGGQSTVANDTPRISDDARFILFSSNDTSLVSGDTNTATDVFLKDMESGVLIRVSTTTEGAQANGASVGSFLSGDGRYVAFRSTADNLVSGDGNLVEDIFRKDLLTGVVQRVSVSDGGVEGDLASNGGAVMSADGRYFAFVSTATNLLSGDTNGTNDIFFKDMKTLGVQQMSGMLVTNRVSAGITLQLAQRYRDDIIGYRAQLGASLSRAGSFLNVLQSADINYKAASSRIADADVAVEAANVVRARILQETASSLLAQANQEPQIALSLLRSA